MNADIWAPSYSFVTPNMDKTKPPSVHHSKRSSGSKDTSVGHKNQDFGLTDCPEPAKRWNTQSTIDKYSKGTGARQAKQSESSSSVECVQSDSRLRHSHKRSRAKSIHEGDTAEQPRDANNGQNTKETNSEDSPFLQMLSDDLDALRSPKNKYFHKSSSKHTKAREDTKKFSSMISSFEIKSELQDQAINSEESPLPCIKKEVQESDLEEGELIEEPDEKPSPQKSKKHRQSKKGKVGTIQAVSAQALDWSGVECQEEFTLKSEELNEKKAHCWEGELFRLSSKACIGKRCADHETPRVDSPLLRDFAQKCRPLSPEEGEIMSPQIDAREAHSDELFISCNTETVPESKKEKHAFLKSSAASWDHGSNRSCETKTHLQPQSVRDATTSDITQGITGAVLRNMMQGLYSQNTSYSHRTVSAAETLSWNSFPEYQPAMLQLPLQPVQSYGLPAQMYVPVTGAIHNQTSQQMTTFLRQYQDLCSNLLSSQSTFLPYNYSIPAQTTGLQPGQWYTPTPASSLGTSSSHYFQSTAASAQVGQQSPGEPLDHRHQNHSSDRAHGRSTIRPQATSGGAQHPGMIQPVGSDTMNPEVNSKLRKWDVLKTVDSRRARGMEFTLMTYNILAQEYLDQNIYLYSRCEPRHLAWEFRGPALIAQIISHNADIVCLQEVQESHWLNNLKEPFERHGYQHVYQRKSKAKPDGCAVLFKGDKFKKIKFVQVDFKKGGLLDRDNIGVILLLQPTPQGCKVPVPQICVATTHLLFNPKRGDVKLAQLMLFLAEIDKHAYLEKRAEGGAHGRASSSSTGVATVRPGPTHDKGVGSDPKSPKAHSAYCPIILCGDFNTEPFCDLYKFITTGYLKYEKCLSKLLCGQKEGQTDGWAPPIGKEVMPKGLEISQTCQYTHLLRQRYTSLHLPDNRVLKNSGKVYHDMDFKSVYPHSFVDKHGRQLTEVTSQHERSLATVDYIFYSSGGRKKEAKVKPNQRQAEDSALESLELLARYRLLTTGDIRRSGRMPNTVFPSDHFCLIAKFYLS